MEQNNIMKQKILFLIPSLAGGGAEHVFLHLMNNIDREKYDLHLAVWTDEGPYFAQLKSDVYIINLKTSFSCSLLKVIGVINRLKPDVVLSNIFCMNFIVGFARPFISQKTTRFLARESDIPSKRRMTDGKMKFFDLFYPLSYSFFDRIICQSDDMLQDVHELYRVPMDKLLKIHNPVDMAYVDRQSKKTASPFSVSRINLLTVGRLHPVKDLGSLLNAMALTENEKLHLHILGEGEAEAVLRSQTETLKLQDRVTFHGFKDNPYPYMAAADAFVMTSLYEGFPNAMVEAMALGCPVVAFHCQGGISEIIQSGQNGYLIESGNMKELAEVLDRGRFLELDRQMIASEISNRFSLDRIIGQYEKILTVQDMNGADC